MTILTEADKAIFFPRVAATGNELTGLILATQTMIEAKIGRTLEIKNYVQTTKTVNAIAQIQYTPVVAITKLKQGNCVEILTAIRDRFQAVTHG